MILPGKEGKSAWVLAGFAYRFFFSRIGKAIGFHSFTLGYFGILLL